MRSNLAIVGDDFHRQTGQFRRGRGNAPQSLVTKKMLKKDLLWLALTGLDKDVMEFSLNARRVNEGFLFEQTAQIRSLLRQTR
ncbi:MULTISPECIES: hypothetical protein [Bradyrhizobium]|uniref:hypothetical protein n=1 Tax=Bradyrhizobium TaxID=374 RepID=UPI000F535904|nr:MULTISPECIES: hypothetical protein [Bradyrhizobium]MCA1543573.1 hypothetical protein [Bradyrhizobium sp. NBAIM32]RQH03018.1 hypothetical protein EHH60_35540 [Bradyrhizobium sp. RP6]UWU93765.1 hypothetical protein N2604_07885 [Bradyrhizobium sp. CB1015]